MIYKEIMGGYATRTIDIKTICVCMLLTAIAAIYIYFFYKLINRNSFYNRAFSMSLIGIAIITAAIILTIQSNIVVSLGMVGALSIVRFRTAIKDPMDLVFLFWSISAGIICGAGFCAIEIIASIVFTILILLISLLPSEKGSLVLVVNADDYVEKEILDVCKQMCNGFKVRARNISSGNVNMVIEVTPKDSKELIEKTMELEHIVHVSLVEHDGDITV